MELLLTLHSPFKGSDLIDEFRQINLDLHTKADKESIDNFLNEVISFLEDPLNFERANEIFSTIFLCFSRFPNYSLPFLRQLLDNFKTNENFILITTSIIFDLTYNHPQLSIPYYSSFIDDSLKEIQNQIINENINQLILFGHQIPTQFSNSLVLNLFLLSKPTNTLIKIQLMFSSLQDVILK